MYISTYVRKSCDMYIIVAVLPSRDLQASVFLKVRYEQYIGLSPLK